MKLFTTVFMILLCLNVETTLGLTVEQTELSWTKPEGKSAYIKCKVPGMPNSGYVHWYQQKDGEALRRILYANKPGSILLDSNHPDSGDFTVPNDSHDLKVKTLKKSHSAVYYCACWDGENASGGYTYAYQVFGSGTRLIVTDKEPVIKKPNIIVYPIVKEDNGRRTMLCQAKDMEPKVVRITWKKGTNNLDPSDDVEILEQNEEEQNRVTSMVIVNEKSYSKTDKYSCKIQHESSTTPPEATLEEKEGGGDGADKEAPADPKATCAPKTVGPDKNSGSAELVRSLYLFNFTYVSLLLKNVLYFCAVVVLLYKKRLGSKQSLKTSLTPKQET